MKTEDDYKDLNLYQKLINAKKEMGAIKKSSINPFFKSKYADLTEILQAVEPALLENGLLLIQPIEDGKVFSIITDGKTELKSYIELGNFNKPQDMGSAITYYRRYTIQSLLGLSAEDDDGNNAHKGFKVNKKLNEERFEKALLGLRSGNVKIEQITKYTLTEDQKAKLNELITKTE